MRDSRSGYRCAVDMSILRLAGQFFAFGVASPTRCSRRRAPYRSPALLVASVPVMNGCFLAEQSAARSTEVLATIVMLASVALETIAIDDRDDRGDPSGADVRFGASRDRKHAAVTVPQSGLGAPVCGREP
jgi:hypothetical protein